MLHLPQKNIDCAIFMKYEWQTCAEFSEEKGGKNSPFQIPVKTKQKSTPGSVISNGRLQKCLIVSNTTAYCSYGHIKTMYSINEGKRRRGKTLYFKIQAKSTQKFIARQFNL